MKLTPANIIYVVLTLLGAVWLWFTYSRFNLPPDPGDGVQHFFYAQAVFKAPMHLFNHWAKPLFTLFTAPFAQLGFSAVVAFNIAVYVMSALTARMLMLHLGVKPAWMLIFPPLLLISGDYVITVIGGLTEPLFNLFVLFAAYFMVRRKWVAFALVVSCMPFLRSEGQLVVLLAGAVLLWARSFKAMPFLLTAFLVYGLAGRIFLHDFLWYFHDSPYDAGNQVYGSGSYFHYFISYRNYLDNAGLYLMILAVVLFFVEGPKYRRRLHLPLLLFGGALFFGIVLVHAVLYGKGMYGAAGLTRLATQGLPLFFVLLLYLISSSRAGSKNIREGWLPKVGLLLLAGIVLGLLTSKRHVPKTKILTQELLKSADVPSLADQSLRVYYHHPIVPYLQEGNPFVPGSRFHFYQNSGHWSDDLSAMPSGSLLVWDAQFGPQEMALPFDLLQEANRGGQLELLHPDAAAVSNAPLVAVFRKR